MQQVVCSRLSLLSAQIAGYSVDVLHSGLFCHSILLQKDFELKAITITTGKDEVGRSILQGKEAFLFQCSGILNANISIHWGVPQDTSHVHRRAYTSCL